MSTYRNTRRDVAIADDYLANHLPCRRCNSLTDWDTLSNLGALCHECHQAWCAEANPVPMVRLSPSQRLATLRKLRDSINTPRDPKAWAWSLRDREHRGENLSKAQKDAWRVALRFDADARAHISADVDGVPA
jgi:hypothetical protein